MYPALLRLVLTTRLPVVEWTEEPADLNGLVLFAERRNLVSVRVPSHLKRSLVTYSKEKHSSSEGNRFSANQVIPCILGIGRIITAFTSSRQLFLSWASSIQCIHSSPTSWISILILSSNLRLVFPNVFFPSDFSTKTLYKPLHYPQRAKCPAHLIRDFIKRTTFCEQYQSFSSSLCSFLHSPVSSSFLGPNILLNTLFSNTSNLRSSLNLGDPSFTPIQKTEIVLFLHIITTEIFG
jgi:hypothetical protein